MSRGIWYEHGVWDLWALPGNGYLPKVKIEGHISTGWVWIQGHIANQNTLHIVY